MGSRARARLIAGVLAGALVPAAASGSVSGVNLLEAQAGNEPGEEPANRVGLYEQLTLRYSADQLDLGLRFETDRNSENEFPYEEITQRWATWTDEHLEVRVGNFYTILGRGLLHRSFDLPGVILDQPGQRSRYGFSRDVDGVLVEGRHDIFGAKLFSGSPNAGEFSPGTASAGLERYQGQESGAELTVSPHRSARLGAAYVRATSTGVLQRELGSAFFEADPLAVLGSRSVFAPFYVEYATIDAPFDEWADFRTGPDDPHALYASLNVLWEQLTLAAEWKSYTGFRLGTNDPPSLVREHGFALLNRHTHVLNADREVGFQLEGSYTLPTLGTLTVNRSGSNGHATTRFDETYLEAYVAPDAVPEIEATAFFDTGRDDFVGLPEIDVYGLSVTAHPDDRLAVTLGAERLEATRGRGRDRTSFADRLLSVSVGLANTATVALVWENSEDPEESDAFPVPDGFSRDFVNGTLSFTLDANHDVQLFMGERRGGLACTAGTCYQVLPFEGVELRLTSRFR